MSEKDRILDERVLMAQERTSLASERTRLANERTFSAWIRTGLASAGGGIAIIRLLSFENYTHQIAAQWIGTVLVLIGIAIFFLSVMDYWSSYKRLKSQKRYVGSIIAVTAMAFILIIALIILLVITVHQHHMLG